MSEAAAQQGPVSGGNIRRSKDIPLLVGCSLAITFVFALGNLAADLLYAVLNPRVRHGRNAS